MGGLPTGTVTFLFTDVEGSTRLLARLGEGYAAELEAHRAIVREAAARANGAIVDQYGDEAFVAFSRAQDAVDAAREIQQRHAGRVMRIRIGLHTGEPTVHGEGYSVWTCTGPRASVPQAMAGRSCSRELRACCCPAWRSTTWASTSCAGSRARSGSTRSTSPARAAPVRCACGGQRGGSGG